MILGLDYDGTYTADPEFWDAVCVMAVSRGHTVVMVTARCADEMEDVSTPKDVAVYCTCRKPKKMYMEMVHRIRVDVWIDDMPEGITLGIGAETNRSGMD